MNFRVNLAVAFAAAFSFACSEKPAATPDLKAALNAPQGMKVVGLYRMDVTPVATPQGMVYEFQPIPVDSDGNANTNPPGTVQVRGAFGAVAPAAGLTPRCADGVNTISAPVRITNFAVETLTNVWVEIMDMNGTTGNVACNPDIGPAGSGAAMVGTWRYNDLSGAPDNTGLLAGGNSLPIKGAWTFRYVTTQPFRFFFRVMAENSAPVPAVVDPAGPTAPLTWTGTTADSRIEICSVDPDFGPSASGFVQNPCPVPLTTAASVTSASPVAPYAFSYAPTVGFTPGNSYYWRVRNVYAGGPSTFYSSWNFFTFQGPALAAPVVTPVTLLANDTTAPVSWTADAAVTQTYAYLCQGPCPDPLPAPLPAAQGNVLFQGAYLDAVPGANSFFQDDLALMGLLTTAAGYFDTTITYDLRVFAYDGVTLPTSGPAGATAAITITPVQELPTLTTVEPATYSNAAPDWTVSWTADAIFTNTLVDVCTPDCATDPAPSLGLVVAPVAGTYTIDLMAAISVVELTPPGTGTGTFEFWIYNPDLAPGLGTATGGIRNVGP